MRRPPFSPHLSPHHTSPRDLRGTDKSYDERVLPSIGNEVLKATVAQFDGTSTIISAMDRVQALIAASELITNREIVSARIRDDLLNRAKEFGIQLEDVSIVSVIWLCVIRSMPTPCVHPDIPFQSARPCRSARLSRSLGPLGQALVDLVDLADPRPT